MASSLRSQASNFIQIALLEPQCDNCVALRYFSKLIHIMFVQFIHHGKSNAQVLKVENVIFSSSTVIPETFRTIKPFHLSAWTGRPIIYEYGYEVLVVWRRCYTLNVETSVLDLDLVYVFQGLYLAIFVQRTTKYSP